MLSHFTGGANMAHATTNDSYLADPDLRESLRVIQHERSMHMIAVGVALVAAIATAVAYASLSYSDRNEAVPAQVR